MVLELFFEFYIERALYDDLVVVHRSVHARPTDSLLFLPDKAAELLWDCSCVTRSAGNSRDQGVTNRQHRQFLVWLRRIQQTFGHFP